MIIFCLSSLDQIAFNSIIFEFMNSDIVWKENLYENHVGKENKIREEAKKKMINKRRR